jgi:hypothetical protein
VIGCCKRSRGLVLVNHWMLMTFGDCALVFGRRRAAWTATTIVVAYFPDSRHFSSFSYVQSQEEVAHQEQELALRKKKELQQQSSGFFAGEAYTPATPRYQQSHNRFYQTSPPVRVRDILRHVTIAIRSPFQQRSCLWRRTPGPTMGPRPLRTLLPQSPCPCRRTRDLSFYRT